MRHLKLIYTHFIQRRIPFGLFSWRFLLPFQSSKVHFHRQLVMLHYPQIPRFIWVVIVLVVGLRWMLFYSPYFSYKIIRRHHAQIYTETNMTFWQQWLDALKLSMLHGVHPRDWYQFRFYTKKRKHIFWNYIHTHEAVAFHTFRNWKNDETIAHQSLLGDKWIFEGYCETQSIPIAKTILFSCHTNTQFIEQLYAHTKERKLLFCKQRHGNQARGAFLAEWQQEQLLITPFGKKRLSTDNNRFFLQNHTTEGDYLCQYLYQSHPLLSSGWSDHTNIACTIRAISALKNKKVTLECAYLEWPFFDDKKTLKGHRFIPLDVASGHFQTTHHSIRKSSLNQKQLQIFNLFLQKLQKLKICPYWNDLVQTTEKLHNRLSGIYAIAWDFIITEDSAILLEGNTGWEVLLPQMIQGGYVTNLNKVTRL